MWGGPCLVRFKDGRVAQAYLPLDDFRRGCGGCCARCCVLRLMLCPGLHRPSTPPPPRPCCPSRPWSTRRRRLAYAMEAHGVEVKRTAFAPALEQYVPPTKFEEFAEGVFVNVLPYVAVALVYAATTYARWLKVGEGGTRRARQCGWRERRAARALGCSPAQWPAPCTRAVACLPRRTARVLSAAGRRRRPREAAAQGARGRAAAAAGGHQGGGGGGGAGHGAPGGCGRRQALQSESALALLPAVGSPAHPLPPPAGHDRG